MDITLTWVGPYRHGHFGELEKYPYAREPHVYVSFQTFHSIEVAAVGQAGNLSSRINEYLRDLLSRRYSLGDENQTENGRPPGDAEADGLGIFDSIDEWLGVAVAEVKGFSFFAAPCDQNKLDDVEAELINRLGKRAESSGGHIVRENWQKKSNLQSGELILKFQFSTPAAQGVLQFISETPVHLPAARRTDPASSIAPTGSEVYTYSAPGMPMCPECDQRPAIFYCSAHRTAVCLECVDRHDKRGGCVYVPAFRAPRSTTTQEAASGQTKPPGAAKPQSILGID